MATDDTQLDRFGEAVEEKKQAAKEASEQTGAQNAPGSEVEGGEQRSLSDHAHEQDDRDIRAKNSGHGKKTADKWNQ